MIMKLEKQRPGPKGAVEPVKKKLTSKEMRRCLCAVIINSRDGRECDLLHESLPGAIKASVLQNTSISFSKHGIHKNVYEILVWKSQLEVRLGKCNWEDNNIMGLINILCEIMNGIELA
jgi:hypothetical protein